MQIIIIGIFALAVVFLIGIFNHLVRLRFLVKEAWSDIDVQLKKRHDLIPNIVEVVKSYKEYEQRLFAQITQLRSKAMANTTNIKEKSELENQFSFGIKNLFALVEAYPDLKANKNFLDLQKTLIRIENDIEMARRYYNGTVRNLNTAVETFPSNLVSFAFHFKSADFFEIEYATERQVPDVKI
ncbi:MAG: LemA family protein [Candidatus Omnitrophica bacterium]|nr:LemA family protein [Candidatus Omnitrophota bacterium]MBU1047903.1 LemA family protein [Candidatus Omnitrophota bacterium]MBU1888526.1 LemA family protein [Candidatus Omnitrophota bacterium]